MEKMEKLILLSFNDTLRGVLHNRVDDKSQLAQKLVCNTQGM